MGKIVAAIPTNRPELCKEAVKAWRATGQFDEIWVIYDGLNVQEAFGKDGPGDALIFDHHSMEGYPHVFPQRSSCIRSFLVYQAWRQGDVEWLVHLDDDVRPMEFLAHARHLWRPQFERGWHGSRWYNTVARYFARGTPFGERKRSCPLKIVHAQAIGVPDVLGIDQLMFDCGIEERHVLDTTPVPSGQYFPMSSQAVAIHRDLFPASYFLWMGWDLPLNKFGDIWCGVILKKICDHFGWACVINEPIVLHERASDPWKNMEAEAPMLKYNEHWWEWVDAVGIPHGDSVRDAYYAIAYGMHMPDEPAFKELREKMLAWCELFEEKKNVQKEEAEAAAGAAEETNQ